MVACSHKDILGSPLFFRWLTLLIFPLLTINSHSVAQTTNVVVLDSAEITRLRQFIATNDTVRQRYDSIVQLTEQYLIDTPRPLKVLHYEGLLESNPDRIDTKKSLAESISIPRITPTVLAET